MPEKQRPSTGRLLSSTKSLARRIYTNKKVDVWCVMLHQTAWRAHIIDTKSKLILDHGDIGETWEDAVAMLKKQLEKEVASNAW